MTGADGDATARPRANPFVTALGGIAVGLIAVGWALATFILGELTNTRFGGAGAETQSHYVSLSLWKSFATQAAVLGVATGVGVLAYLAWEHSTRSGSRGR